MKRMMKIGVLVGLVLAWSVTIAPAADGPLGAKGVRFVDNDLPVLSSTTVEELKSVSADLGFSPEEKPDTDGDPSLVLTMAGLKVAVLLYHDQDGHILSLGLQSNFRLDQPPTLDTINQWNVARRYSRAYLTNGKVTLENDLDLQGGVTWKTVTRFLTTFQHSVGDFAKHIHYAT